MIKLDNIKYVLFDFDDTLCIHNKHGEGDDSAYNVAVLSGMNPWKLCNKSEHMQIFINICKAKNIKLGLISSTLSYKHMEAKQKWAEEGYDTTLENFCVGSPEAKIEIMKALAESQHIERHNIMIIDDLYLTLDRAVNNGFKACSPMEIVNFIEGIKLKEQLNTV